MKNETNSNYINAEVDKIIDGKEYQGTEKFAMASAWILGNFKGLNLKVMNVGPQSSLADYFVLASATNTVQANAMADEILTQFKRHNKLCKSKEGQSDSDWILLDFGDFLVHIFLETSRGVYDLDRLWTDAPSITIPHSFYFSTPEAATETKKTDKNYF